MTILAPYIPYSKIGPKVKVPDFKNRIHKRVIEVLYKTNLHTKVLNHPYTYSFRPMGKPKKKVGIPMFEDVAELDKSQKYKVRVEIPITLEDKFLVSVEVVVLGIFEYVNSQWEMEAHSWENNIISLQSSPDCEELLFHSRDFSQDMKQGHSSKNPWHHQWHVTAKKKLDNEKCHHFIWKPYYYSNPVKKGINDKKRWLYKNDDHTKITEFWLKDFFELCDQYATSGILRDRSFFIAY